MGRVRNPVSFSNHFNIPTGTLEAAGAFDPILNADSRLFIDPVLLGESGVPEAVQGAHRLRRHFESLVRLLTTSGSPGDSPFRAARRLMRYREVAATCLGYGASTTGSGLGDKLTDALLKTAKEIIDLGVRDPEMFVLLPFLEENVGPDRVSDITTNIILPELSSFTERVLSPLHVPLTPHTIATRTYRLPTNPFGRRPILLVPHDCLRVLPIATDWDSVAAAAAHNEALRSRVNAHIAEIMKSATERDKTVVREQARASREAVEALLDAVRAVPRSSYDIVADMLGVALPSKAAALTQQHPLTLCLRPGATADEIWEVVRAICSHFSHLLERRDIWRLLWHNSKPRKEGAAQLLFFAIASSYCRANNLDLTPEAETGRGPVDFKISQGHAHRFLVEIKLSTNPKLVPGFSTQLELYKQGEDTIHALYLVIDVGKLGDKDQKLLDLRAKALQERGIASEILFVSALPRPSASKADTSEDLSESDDP